MRKHRSLKRLTISRETLRHLEARDAAHVVGAATDTCFETCPVTCMVSCAGFITCGCPPSQVDCGPSAPPMC